MRSQIRRRVANLEDRLTERQLWEHAIFAGIPPEHHAAVREALKSTPYDGRHPMANLTIRAVFACPRAYAVAFYHQLEIRLSVPGFVEMMENGPAEACRRWFTETMRAAAECPADEDAVVRRIRAALEGPPELLMGRMVEAHQAERERELCA